jgi:protoheme IX farnesyltransferase
MSTIAGRYFELCKPRVVALIVFTAVVGMFLAVPGWPPLSALIAGTLGIGLAASSAAAINHLLDQRIDAVMARTRNRPLPSGQLQIGQVLVFALILGVVSMTLLVVWVNTLTAVLTFLSLIGYAVVYTVWLKRATPQNIVIGGAAGAAPPVLGWTAVTGMVDHNALILFLIIYVWTPPHFWALAIRYREDYARAEVPMLPVVASLRTTAQRIFLYTLLLWAITLLFAPVADMGPIYVGSALVLGAIFTWLTLRLMRDNSAQVAMRVFTWSITYITLLFAAIAVDELARSGL